MFTPEQGTLMNSECSIAFSGVLRKMMQREPDRHALFVMSSCGVALRYLQFIHMIGIAGYSPIAVSLSRTYLEIICATMYLAAHKEELDDFLNYGRLMFYESGEGMNIDGKLLNQLVPDHETLRAHFKVKKAKSGKRKHLSWHGMSLNELRDAVELEKFAQNEADVKTRRSHYDHMSKLVHGDSLIAILAYNLDQGTEPIPFAPAMEAFRVDALGSPCPLFIVLLASIGVALNLDITEEFDRLNGVWKRIWEEATGEKVPNFVQQD